MFEKLTDNLEQQVQTHQHLFDLIAEENMLPHDASLDELQALKDSKDLTLQRARILEEDRLSITRALRQELGAPEEAKLEELAHHAPDSLRERLVSAKGSLLLLVREIQRLARENAEKAQLRANCYKEVIGGVHKKHSRMTSYGASGKIKGPQGSVFLNKSI